MKKTFSFIALWSMLISLAVPFIGTVNAELTTKKVRVVVTYPISDATLWVDAWALVHEPNSWILFRFALKNSSDTTLCMEEKSVSVVNWIMTYELGSQYAINTNWVSTWCNMSSLLNNSDYKIVATWDLNKNNDFTDWIDFTSEEATWVESSTQQFEDSFLDSKTLDMQNNITAWGGWESTVNYNVSAGLLNTELIAAWSKTKTFDLDKDWATEVISKNGTDPWIIYSVNKVSWTYENVFSSSNITLDDSTNVFLAWKDSNFILKATFGSDPNITKTNLAATSIVMKNWMVTESSQTVKEFVATDYLVMNISWEDKRFNFSTLSRQYEEQIAVSYWNVSDLYSSLTDPDWSWTPFSWDQADYYWWDVREAIVNNTVVSDIDGVIYWDFNEDWRLDFISFKNATWGKAYFTMHLRKTDWSYKIVFDSILWDWVTAWTSLVDNSADFSWTDINEIIITDGTTKNVYKINWAWETNPLWDWDSNTVKLIASFSSTFYAILAKNGWTTNVNSARFSIWDGFRDMNDSNIDDKFLLVWDFKVNKDWYDYYDYYLKQYNWSSFVDLTLSWSVQPFKAIWDKIWFQKIANSEFYAFYVDQSTQSSKWLQDKTNLYYIKDWKIIPMLSWVLINDNNTWSHQDGNLNEWGSKLLNNSKFGFFDQNVSNVTSWTLWIPSVNFISNSWWWALQYEEWGNKYYIIDNNWDIQTSVITNSLNSVFTKLTDNTPVYLNLNKLFKSTELVDVYTDINWLTYWIWNVETIQSKSLIDEINLTVYSSAFNIGNYIDQDTFISNYDNIFLWHESSSRNIVFSNNLVNTQVDDYGTDKYVHTVDNLRWSYFSTVSDYLYRDNWFTNTWSISWSHMYYVWSDWFIHKTFLDWHQTNTDNIIHAFSSKELKKMWDNIYFIDNSDWNSLYKIDTVNNDTISKVTWPTNLRFVLNIVWTRVFMINNSSQVVVYDESTWLSNVLTSITGNSYRPLLTWNGSYYWIKFKESYYDERIRYFQLDANLNPYSIQTGTSRTSFLYWTYYHSMNLSTSNTDWWNWAVNTNWGFTYSNTNNRYNTNMSTAWGWRYWNYLVYPNSSDWSKLYKFDVLNEWNHMNSGGKDAFANNTQDRKLFDWVANYPVIISWTNFYNWNNHIVVNTDNIYFMQWVSYYWEWWSLKPFLDTNWSKRLDKIVWWDMNWNSNSNNSVAGTLNLNDTYNYAHNTHAQADQWDHSWRWWWDSVSWCNASADINLESKFWPVTWACWEYQWWGWYKFFPLY